MRNVYGCLTLGLLTSLVGAVVNYVFDFNFRLLFTIAIFGLMIALITTPATRANEKTRLMYFFGFTFLTGISNYSFKWFLFLGCNLTPFIQALDAEPAIIFVSLIVSYNPVFRTRIWSRLLCSDALVWRLFMLIPLNISILAVRLYLYVF